MASRVLVNKHECVCQECFLTAFGVLVIGGPESAWGCAMLSCLSLLSALLAASSAAAAPANFLLVNGVTAVDEACLVGSGAGVWLDSCETAVSSLSGKEIWSLASDGSLVHEASKKCLGAGSTGEQSNLELLSCDAAGGVPKWELQANGQVKMAQTTLCISQAGASSAVVNVAATASALASSTLDPSHGAAHAVDGVASSYWVSKMGETSVSLLLDLGEPAHASLLDVDFEFVPSAFAVQVARPTAEWRQIFATDSNVLRRVKIPLDASTPLSGVKLVMQTAHPTLGALGSQKLFGVRSVKVMANLLTPVLEPCAAAAKSPDGRDKFFAVAVKSFDPQAAAALEAELPALESADAALSSAVVELAAALPDMSSCKSAGAVLLSANATIKQVQQKALRRDAGWVFGVNQEAALLQEARETIVAARGLLASR